MGISLAYFNKAGARLLQKSTGIKIKEQVINLDGKPFSLGFKPVHGAKPPQNAATASYSQVERKFGEEKIDIVSFFDDNGKLIQRQRFIEPKGAKRYLESVSDYKNTPVRTSTYMDKTTVEQEVFYCHTQSFKPNGKLNKDSFSNVSIDHQKNLYGRSDSTLKTDCIGIFESANRNSELPGTLHKADLFETKLQQWSKNSPRQIYERKIIYNPSTGNFTPISSKGKNLTQNEINLLNQDKYLPLRFHPRLNSYEYLKKDAFAAQNIPLDTKIKYEKISKDTTTQTAGYVRDNDPSTIHFIYRDGHQQHPGFLHTAANNLNHESRHIWQYRLVDDLKNGKIQNPELKKMAQALKESFEKPRITPEKDMNGYMQQFHETDAYKAGDSAGDIVWEGTKNLRKVFKTIV